MDGISILYRMGSLEEVWNYRGKRELFALLSVNYEDANERYESKHKYT